MRQFIFQNICPVHAWIDELSNSYAGGNINDKCINHIMYADDICLMAPTGSTMQNLLDVCHNYGTENDI